MPSRAIRDLPFAHSRTPGLGFEMFRLSSLYARAGRLGHALDAPQRPEFHTVYVGIRGRGALSVDFTRVPIGANTVTVVARGRVQSFVVDHDVDAWMLLFTPEFLSTQPGSADPLVTPVLLATIGAAPAVAMPRADHAELLALVAQLDAEQARPPDAYQPWVLSAMLRAVLLRATRRAGAQPAPAVLGRFFTILDRDCTLTRSVAHYAKVVGLSPRRLAELLVAETGKSTKQIIDERVILEHKRLLAHTSLTIKELAARTGFDEPTNLVKFFRHHTGQTPQEFRDYVGGNSGRRILPSRRRS
jgi:AraC-like DNA-binding protein